MTTISALIPRLRFNRLGRVVAIRCAACRKWTKSRYFNRNTGSCHECTYSEARRRLLARVAHRR